MFFVSIKSNPKWFLLHLTICIWYPFECDMGLDGTLTSHIERVEDDFDMACQSAI